MAYQRKWLEPRQAFNHVSAYVPNPFNAEYQLFRAVYEGAIRVRYRGRELTGEERWRLLNVRHGDPEHPWALPVDIELWDEDIRRIWNNETYPLPPERRRGKRGPEPGKTGLVKNRELFPRVTELMSTHRISAEEAFRILKREGKLASRGGDPDNVARHWAGQYRKWLRSE